MSVPITQDVAGAASPEAAIVAALGSRSIVLVGMMGAGKSSIGRRLAARLAIPFADADSEIEVAHHGMSIPDIFATYGEPYFRSGETRVIARLLKSGPQVLATGGGAFMNADTREAIATHGISIWLKADLGLNAGRIARSCEPRIRARPCAPSSPSATRSMRAPTSRSCRARCRTRRSSRRSSTR